MDEVEIDARHPQAVEALGQRLQRRLEPLVAVPELGGDEDLVAVEPRRRERPPDALLVAVGRGGVDVPVAGLERHRDHALGVLRRNLEDPEPELGDLDAVVEPNIRNLVHGCGPPVRSVPAVTPGRPETSATVKATAPALLSCSPAWTSSSPPATWSGLSGPNGAGKSTLLRILAGRPRRESGSVAVSPPTARSATWRRSRAAAGRDGARVPRPPHRRRRRPAALDAAADALAGVPRGRRRVRAALDAGSRSAARTSTSGRHGRRRRRRSASTSTLPMTALSGGQAAAPGSPRCCCRATTCYCSTSPPTTSTSTGSSGWSSSSRAALAGRHRQPRPGVPGPHGEPGRRARPRQQQVGGLRRRLRQLPRRARGRPAGTRARPTRSTPTRAGRSRTAPACSATGWRRASATPGARRPTTTSSVRPSAPRPSEKQAAKARQTERLIERLEVVEEPRKEWELRMTIAAAPALGDGRRDAARRGVRRGSFTLGPVDAAASTGRTGSWSPGRTGRARRRCWAPCSGGSRSTRAAAGSGSSVRVGEIDQARGLFLGPEPLVRASATRCRTGRSATSARCWPSSG